MWILSIRLNCCIAFCWMNISRLFFPFSDKRIRAIRYFPIFTMTKNNAIDILVLKPLHTCVNFSKRGKYIAVELLDDKVYESSTVVG